MRKWPRYPEEECHGQKEQQKERSRARMLQDSAMSKRGESKRDRGAPDCARTWQSLQGVGHLHIEL